jgi:hypothetical protein
MRRPRIVRSGRLLPPELPFLRARSFVGESSKIQAVGGWPGTSEGSVISRTIVLVSGVKVCPFNARYAVGRNGDNVSLYKIEDVLAVGAGVQEFENL